MAAVRSLGAAHLRQPPVRLIKSEFDLRDVHGLSPRALETHLALYEGYVNAANGLYEQLFEYPPGEALTARERLEREGLVRRLSFEHNGALLHEIFFEALGARRGAPAANGVFQEGVESSFGGFDAWKQDVVDIGQTRGVGWVVTCRSRGDNRLFNVWLDDHTRGLLVGLEPVAVFDLWEHAYLLDFKPSQRADYLCVLLDNMNWDVVESRCVG